MKVSLWIASVLVAGTAIALDEVRPYMGTPINGRVLAYRNQSFDIELEDGTKVTKPTSWVKEIVFEAAAQPTEQTTAAIKAKITVYNPIDKAAYLETLKDKRNLAKGSGGKLSASSGDQESLAGLLQGKRDHDWFLIGAIGWIECEWRRPVKATKIVLVNRPQSGMAPWGDASIFINGQLVGKMDPKFAAQHVAEIDLQQPIQLKSSRLEILGKSGALGLASLELYEK